MDKDNRYNEIRLLLEKFYNGETSPSEDSLLSDFFLNEIALPDDLLPDKAVFEALRSSEDDIEVPDDLDHRIIEAVSGKNRRRVFFRIATAVAAAVAMIAVIPLVSYFKNSDFSDEGNMASAGSDSLGAEEPLIQQSIVPAQTPAHENHAAATVDEPKPQKIAARGYAEACHSVPITSGSEGEGELTEEEIKAMNLGFTILEKAGRKMAYASDKAAETDAKAAAALEKIDRILNDKITKK